MENNSLLITALSPDLVGNYTCVASNPAGTSNSTVTVTSLGGWVVEGGSGNFESFPIVHFLAQWTNLFERVKYEKIVFYKYWGEKLHNA